MKTLLRSGLGYWAGLIGLYLVVANGSKAGAVISEGAKGATTFTKTLQGR